MSKADLLLEIKDLHVSFKSYRGPLKVLDGVNLTVGKGEKVGLVGETGCGKTTTMKAVMRILPTGQALIPRGEITFKGKDVLKMKTAELLKLRRSGVSMIFQDPTAALNPVFSVGNQIGDVIKYARVYQTGAETMGIRGVAVKALSEVSLPDPERMLESYPIQLSGGMRQRVCIAMAVSTPRELLIADEPGTSLDVTIQDQVLRLIRTLVEKKGTSVVLVTHSLGVVREMTDRVYVMYAGNIVEVAPTRDLFADPLHPYTIALMGCVPKLSGGGISEGIPGRMPDYLNPPKGCRFHPRCSRAKPICREEKPAPLQVGKDHQVACFLYQDDRG
ncbi:MAG: ABC transporter ATP-binding protein [Firmicutes bacterium]|nr:ABC transporter ATP-binding protein [Bacillota bacterium]